ncbi:MULTISPECIES: hypothetical protein [Streptomyces]|uniref:Uncharacterized protein n=1 Tax=Streptomyces apricus TaxID=1828112 RepID=A0A5B0BED6_9ACTN|nr:hypothetical protein [Streptomyces apricus]KAA0940410.1 hypothetical protein FGF04_10000 [Streptomyces apricus]
MSESMQGDTGRVQQAGETAKAEATATAERAKQAAGETAGTAADQARAVVGEARQQAGTVVRDLRERALNEVEGQTGRAADALRQWADDLAGLADNAQNDSPARGLAAHAADRGHRAADYLQKQGAQGVVTDLQGFARRRPGAFLGGALLAGLAVGHLAKVASKAKESSGTGPSGSGTTAEQQPGISEESYPLLPPAPPVDAPQEPAPVDVAQSPPPVGAPEPPVIPAVPQTPPSVGTPPNGVPGRPYPEV